MSDTPNPSGPDQPARDPDSGENKQRQPIHAPRVHRPAVHPAMAYESGDPPSGFDAPYLLDRYSVLTHELANLLDGSLRTLLLAQRSLDDSGDPQTNEADRLRRRLDTVQQSLARMTDLVRASAAGSDASIGAHSLGPRAPSTIAEAAHHAADVLGPIADERGVELTLSIQPEASVLPAQPLYTVVLNALRNAIDAAVATSFALSICRPYSCGIGGGGFMVIWIADSQKAVVIDYRETAPAAATPDMFINLPDGASQRGGAAVAVPGTVAGLLEAHERYGRMYLFEILAEVTLLGEQGFLVDEHYESTARSVAERFEVNPEWKQLYPYLWQDLLVEGNARVGDRIFNPRQAELIKRIGRRGGREFYSGDVAEAITSAVQDAGGIITADDIANYAGSIAAPSGLSAISPSPPRPWPFLFASI